jgi:hypothetical protein
MRKVCKTLTETTPLRWLLIALPILLAGPVGAQTSSTAKAPRSGVPESWVGTWAAAPSKDLPPGMKIDNTRTYDPSIPDVLYGQFQKTIQEHLQPWALAKMEATEWDTDDTGQVCKLTGIFRQGSAGGGGFTLLQAPGKIFLVTNVDEVGARRVYFNSEHPHNLAPTWNGDSRAHWDGDVLVIDTIGFNDKSWLSSDREPHTEELHVVERLKPTEYKDTTYIQLQVFVDDRKALKSPYSYSRVIRKVPANAGGGRGGGGGGVCNESEGKMLWQKHREELLDDREKAFSDFIAQEAMK